MGKNILVIIPHASRKRPKEIKKEWLSKNQRRLLYSETSETDRYSELMYDFRKFIGNRQAVFPISQIYLNICRHPDELDEICPPEIRGLKVYNREISRPFRKKMINKYAVPFYEKIEKFKGDMIMAGHTTISGHSSLKNGLPHQIIISNIMRGKRGMRKFAPDKVTGIYVEELKKRLPRVKIGVNSAYVEVYDYLCDRFGWQKNNAGVPIIHQETDENLYIENNILNRKKLNELKKIFAETLAETVKRFKAE